MAQTGQVHKKDFFAIASGSNRNKPTISYSDDEVVERCEFQLLALADNDGIDEFKNDVNSVYFGYDKTTKNITIELFKNGISVGDPDGLWGKTYAYGFQDDGIKKYLGFKINWTAILNYVDDFLTLGEGDYFIRATRTLIDDSTLTEDSFTWCLKTYTSARADRTFRIDFIQNGIIGDWQNDKLRTSFKGLNWHNSLRLPGMVYGEKSEFELDTMQFNNGNQIDVKTEQKPKFDCDIYPIPAFLHRYIKTEVLTSDTIYVSDYNSRNPLRPLLKKYVLFNGNYEPEWKGIVKTASVKIQLEQKINNLRKLPS